MALPQDNASRIQRLEVQMENIITQTNQERQERRETDTVIFRMLGEIKEQSVANKENTTEKINEIKNTLIKWGGIATGAILVLTVIDKLWSHLAK